MAKSCPTLRNPMDCSTPGFLVLYRFPEIAQTHVHWVSETTQPSHPLSSPSPPTFSLSQHQGLFQWVSSSQQVVKVLELQPQHQSFQWRENKQRHELHEETLNLGVGVLSNMDTVKNRDEYQLHCHKELSDWIAATGSTQPVNLLIVGRINCRNV